LAVDRRRIDLQGHQAFLPRPLRDEAAVTNAIHLRYGHGPIKGNVDRMKLIERSMSRRVSFQLLLQKILYRDV